MLSQAQIGALEVNDDLERFKAEIQSKFTAQQACSTAVGEAKKVR